ncbi:MAG: hypothetical protein PX483_01550 [Nostocales cyanobacterium LE14-WE4]|nr:hypothetical protein [Anabaena sp. 49633_E8]MCE2702421.1 hypothetical protein [Anabaena sp. 49633_E8]MDJ0499548.1 hypothetical protein [Nostocales cyanobacterium LE14-WE4]
MSIILENKSIIPFLVEAIAISIQNIRNAIPTERFAIALKTHNTRKAIALITKNTGNAIPTERFAIAFKPTTPEVRSLFLQNKRKIRN